MFIEPGGLPVMNERWNYNGGAAEYPLACVNCRDDCDSWEWIQRRHQGNLPYNLIYTPRGVFCFARKFQGAYANAPWTSGFAWYECGGSMITFNPQTYSGLTQEMILDQFAEMRSE